VGTISDFINILRMGHPRRKVLVRMLPERIYIAEKVFWPSAFWGKAEGFFCIQVEQKGYPFVVDCRRDTDLDFLSGIEFGPGLDAAIDIALKIQNESKRLEEKEERISELAKEKLAEEVAVSMIAKGELPPVGELDYWEVCRIIGREAVGRGIKRINCIYLDMFTLSEAGVALRIWEKTSYNWCKLRRVFNAVFK
jgi:hypothetical protein